VRIGRVTLQAHRSGERLGIRLRDPESPIRTGFTGLDWYPIDPTWRVEGRFRRLPETRTIKILNVVGDLVDEPSPGEVEFEAQGQSLRLVALDAGTRMWFVFRDATAGDETYNTRFLYADTADARGVVTLDFNRAYNPPCAYNPLHDVPAASPRERAAHPDPSRREAVRHSGCRLQTAGCRRCLARSPVAPSRVSPPPVGWTFSPLWCERPDKACSLQPEACSLSTHRNHSADPAYYLV
jgi:hypothetical protein